MPLPTVHVGIPAWRGSAPYLVETIEAVLAQTGADIRVLISVDGNDAGTASLCSKFLADPRVTMAIQPERLGWVGNCNVVLRAGWESGADFYCIQPADDLMEPGYLKTLLAAAEANPAAATVYCDIASFGHRTARIAQPSVAGTALERQLILILRHFAAVAFRGLIRRSLFPVSQPLIQSGAHENFAADTVFMAELARGGDLVRVAEPLYRKRFHAGNTHMAWLGWPDHIKVAAWTRHCVEMLQTALPVAASDFERQLLLGAARSRLLQRSRPRFGFGALVARLPLVERRKMELAFDRAALGDGNAGGRLVTLLGLRNHRGWRKKAERAAGLR